MLSGALNYDSLVESFSYPISDIRGRVFALYGCHIFLFGVKCLQLRQSGGYEDDGMLWSDFYKAGDNVHDTHGPFGLRLSDNCVGKFFGRNGVFCMSPLIRRSACG